jgi:putative ABC transport system permease protein
VRHEVEAVDADQAVAEMRPLNDALDDTLSQPRSTMSILIAFASAALLLAVLGIYGVMAYGVAQRTREIAIRMALGAKTTDVRNLILGQSLRLVAAGIAMACPSRLPPATFIRPCFSACIRPICRPLPV